MEKESKGLEFNHRSVLLDECMEGLAIKPDGIYIDGTAGGAGHSSEIAKKLESGRLVAIVLVDGVVYSELLSDIVAHVYEFSGSLKPIRLRQDVLVNGYVKVSRSRSWELLRHRTNWLCVLSVYAQSRKYLVIDVLQRRSHILLVDSDSVVKHFSAL